MANALLSKRRKKRTAESVEDAVTADMRLVEYTDNRGAMLRVDADKGIIAGVKVLGLTSKNGRDYLPEAVRGAISLYEGVKVNVNHPSGSATKSRGYEERIGKLSNVAFREGDGLYADLHFNPKHALAEQLAWDAEHAPENVGLSHNAQGTTRRKQGRLVVESINRLESVDLVADPATTAGLFEHEEMDIQEASKLGSFISRQMQKRGVTTAQLARAAGIAPNTLTEILRGDIKRPPNSRLTRIARRLGVSFDTLDRLAPKTSMESIEMNIEDLTLDDLQEDRPDLIKLLVEGDEQAKQAAELKAENKKLREQLDAIEAKQAADIRRGQRIKMIVEAGLPDPDKLDEQQKKIVTDLFVETVLAADSDEVAKKHIEERANLLKESKSASSGNPTSRSQHDLTEGQKTRTTDEFVAALK